MARKKAVSVETQETSLYPSPRQQRELIGHREALGRFEEGFSKGRSAHSWLITGPEGIGKATLAYSLARRLLAMQDRGAALPTAEDVPQPVQRRVAEASHTDLKVVEAPAGKHIPVELIRELQQFMHLTAAESAWRVVVIDTADAMNPSAANALLKLLEEPPQGAVLFLLSHAPGRLLPTIRSRCRVLGLSSLSDEDCQRVLGLAEGVIAHTKRKPLALLAGGSPGVAFMLEQAGGLELYQGLLEILGAYPQLPHDKIQKWIDKAVAKANPMAWQAAERLLFYAIHRIALLARGGPLSPEACEGENRILSMLAADKPLDDWLALWEKTGQRFAETEIWNLDHRLILMELFHQIEGSIQ